MDSPLSDRLLDPSVVEEGAGDASAAGPSPKSSLVPLAKPTLGTVLPSSSRITPTLQNIVATANLGCALDLRSIASRARNTEYNPKRFAAVIMRIRDPKTTALLFGTGNIVCTGAKSVQQAKMACRKYGGIVKKLGFPAKLTEFKTRNIVGSCDVHFPIRLEGLAFAHHPYCSYEPELFPGLIYKMVRPKVVLLIFVNGKVVLTGGRSPEDIQMAFDNIYPVLLEFKKHD